MASWRFTSIVILAGFFFSACAHNSATTSQAPVSNSAGVVHQKRSVANDPDQVSEYEDTLQAMLNAPNVKDAEGDMMSSIDRMISLHLRAEEVIKRFDQELDTAAKTNSGSTPVTNRSSRTYNRLVAMELLTHELRTKLTYMYSRLLQIGYSGEGTEKTIANGVVAEVKLKLKNMDPAEKIFSQDLIDDLRDARERFLDRLQETEGAPKTESAQLLRDFQTDFKDHMALMSYKRKYSAAINRRAKNESARNDDEVETLADIVQVTSMPPSGERQPNGGAIIYPSTGTNGTITGHDFPNGAWALTFDDGPSKKYTPTILDNLKKNGIHTTFFWLAVNTKVKGMDAIIHRAEEEKHAVECHSYTHPDLSKVSADKAQVEVIQATHEEQAEYGEEHPIKFFRCPYGSCVRTPMIREMIAGLGLVHVFWNVDSLDWQDKNPDSVVARTRKQMAVQKHGIILFHDIHPQSVVASAVIMNDLTHTDGLRQVTIPAIVDEINENAP